jgi:hypothetical protein
VSLPPKKSPYSSVQTAGNKERKKIESKIKSHLQKNKNKNYEEFFLRSHVSRKGVE